MINTLIQIILALCAIQILALIIWTIIAIVEFRNRAERRKRRELELYND